MNLQKKPSLKKRASNFFSRYMGHNPSREIVQTVQHFTTTNEFGRISPSDLIDFTREELEALEQVNDWATRYGARPRVNNASDLSNLGAAALPAISYCEATDANVWQDFTFPQASPEEPEIRLVPPQSPRARPDLRDADLSAERRRRERIRNEPTLLEDDDQISYPVERGLNFYQQYFHKSLADIPSEELLFEVQYLRESNCRPRLTDGTVLRLLTALFQARPEITTPEELFRHLRLKTHYTAFSQATEFEPSAPSGPAFSDDSSSTSSSASTAQLVEEECQEHRSTVHNSTELQAIRRNGCILSPITSVCPEGIPEPTLVPAADTTHIAPTITKQSIFRPIPSVGQISCDPPPYTAPFVTTAAYTATTTTVTSTCSSFSSSSQRTPSVPIKPSLPPRKVSFGDTTVSHADTMYSPFSGGYSSGITTSTSNSQGGYNSTQQDFSSQFSQIYQDLTRLGLNHTDALKCANDQIAQLYPPQSSLTSLAPQTPNFQSTPLSPSVPAKSKRQLSVAAPQSSVTFTKTSASSLDQSLKEQKQAITLIAAVPPFSGKGSTRFETWIKHFETQLDTADFEEGKKIKLLLSRLTNDALECALHFKERNPISARNYDRIKSCLFERFHGSETRIQYVTEFQNCTQHAGESIRDFACRLQKLFLHAYPVPKGGTMNEMMLMDKFLNGLPSKLQTLLNHREYESFEVLIKKAEARFAADANNLDDTTARINAVAATIPSHQSVDMSRVLQEMSKLCSSMQQNMSIQTEEMQRNFRQMRKDVGQPRNARTNERIGRAFCNFHNQWTNHGDETCYAREAQRDVMCHLCNRRGHNQYFCPTQRNPRPPTPPNHRNQDAPNAQGSGPQRPGN